MNTTPIEKLEYINNRIYIKRDDLLPFSFGGNKVRIAEEFFRDMEMQGKDCIISYGNARSNLNRAIANMAFSKGVPCHIISPADDDGARTVTSNSVLVKTCGAVIHECTKQNVAETVDAAIEECAHMGLNPYYIYGNRLGKGNEATPVSAYVKVYDEILQQEQKMGVVFDYVFCAVGTGMTYAGLLCGQHLHGGNKSIASISVARDKKKETDVINNYCCSFMKPAEDFAGYEIEIIDEYLCEGYGKYNCRIEDTISDAYKTWGIPLDPTYTGKAFWGMKEYIKKNKITNKNILFIHTGGTPLFFDYIQNKDNGVHTE